MTLAIAGEYPWGEWRTVVDSGPGRFERSLILAADTRWSYEGAPPFDRGRKLWTLGRQTGLLLAGDVWAGEDGIRRLCAAGQDAPFRKSTDVTALAEEVFAEVYEVHQQAAKAGRRARVYRLFYLMGLVDANGYTALVRLSSDGNFAPIFLSGIHAIGIPTACQLARAELLDQMGKLRHGQQLGTDAEPWAMATAAATDAAIRSSAQDSVGGAVQLVVGEKTGWREPNVGILHDGGDPLVESDWRTVTCPLADLSTAESQGFHRLASCEDEELAVEQLL